MARKRPLSGRAALLILLLLGIGTSESNAGTEGRKSGKSRCGGGGVHTVDSGPTGPRYTEVACSALDVGGEGWLFCRDPQRVLQETGSASVCVTFVCTGCKAREPVHTNHVQCWCRLPSFRIPLQTPGSSQSYRCAPRSQVVLEGVEDKCEVYRLYLVTYATRIKERGFCLTAASAAAHG